ncbi:MAG: TolC family outer membrane protein [Rickettsiales bacterium]|nr:TolC family outer membrane protein [Rickettsiales bacterium]
MLDRKNNWLEIKMAMLFSMLFLLCALPSIAEARPLRLLLQHIGQTHPAIVTQYEQALASEAIISEAKAGYLPQLGVSASYGYQERDRSGGISSNGVEDSSPLDANLSITQNLFEGFRTNGSVDVAISTMLATNSQYNAVRQQVFLQAINAYIQLVRQQHLLQLSQQNIQTLQNQVALERERMMAGTGISVDVLQTQSRLQLAHDRYASFLGSFHQAEATFTQLFGMKPDYRTLQIPSVSPAAMPRQLQQALKTALANNPTITQSNHQIDAAEQERTVARANYFPRLDVVASSSFSDTGDDISGETSTNALQLRGSWDLFAGFADQSRETRAVHNYQSSLASADNTRRQVVEATERAWAQLVTTQQRATILQNAVSISQQVYRARQRLRDIGSETAINVLGAESELFNSQINAVSALYDSYIARFNLLQAVGMLEPSALL